MTYAVNHSKEIFDMVIVGAGLSGIAAAYHYQKRFPEKRVVILEGREKIGGTWDLFKYPGIRSDSDMHTLGFSFEPWNGKTSIASGPEILAYLEHTVSKYGIDQLIRFNSYVVHSDWSSSDKKWTIKVKEKGREVTQEGTQEVIQERIYEGKFLFMCSGYYDYNKGYLPDWKNYEKFTGEKLHPQFWPEDFEAKDKHITVIGSGATAVTLVPELAKTAKKVVMLQRTPTYYISRPAVDSMHRILKKVLPLKIAASIIRWKYIFLGIFIFQVCRTFPSFSKKLLLKGVRKRLGDKYDEKSFSPGYAPWDQRVCLTPDDVLFNAISSGSVEVVTDRIAEFDDTGIKLASGDALNTDVVVTATGLEVKLMGGMGVSVDGESKDPAQSATYKGMMFSDIPNFALAWGYINSSWTLKCELIAKAVCDIHDNFERTGNTVCKPTTDSGFTEKSLLDLNSGYVMRASDKLPKQGNHKPWITLNNYLADRSYLSKEKTDSTGLIYEK